MKLRFIISLIIAASLLAACAATAQEITFDTVYFEQSGEVLYRVTRIEYDNGSYYQSKEAATKEQVLSIYAGVIEGDMANLAEAARRVQGTGVLFSKAVRLNNSLNTSLQVSPLRELQLKYESPFLNTASSTVWRLNTNNGGADVTFTKNAAGFLIAKVGTDANRTAILAGQVMRLNNYPTQGAVTFFYQIRDGLWRTIDGDVEIRLVRTAERR
jgi:hypothetical protein